GAAGIAAARRVAGAGGKFVVVEANDHVGGRCVTDLHTFGVPYDRGAHWLHTSDLNPLKELVSSTPLEIYPAPERIQIRIAGRNANASEISNFSCAMEKSKSAFDK